MNKLIVVYHSGFGHTKLQAEAVARGAESVDGMDAELMTTKEATDRLDTLDDADAIIFGSPTYMGNIAAEMKAFLEAAVVKWYPQLWKNKIAGAFTNSSSFSGDKLNTLIGLFINAMQQGMIFVGTAMLPGANDREGFSNVEGPGPHAHNRVGSFVGPMAASFEMDPPDAPPKGDLETAEAYGRRVAEITMQFVRGRRGPA
ncbi:MAG: flavodoxin family protein [Thermodesulfobacteriota bacterium]|nr:flavodoxin family protein [Thermodesulfobacteriota bacterium]